METLACDAPSKIVVVFSQSHDSNGLEDEFLGRKRARDSLVPPSKWTPLSDYAYIKRATAILEAALRGIIDANTYTGPDTWSCSYERTPWGRRFTVVCDKGPYLDGMNARRDFWRVLEESLSAYAAFVPNLAGLYDFGARFRPVSTTGRRPLKPQCAWDDDDFARSYEPEVTDALLAAHSVGLTPRAGHTPVFWKRPGEARAPAPEGPLDAALRALTEFTLDEVDHGAFEEDGDAAFARLDYTPRGTLAALKVDQEVVVTAYAGEAVHAILVGGPALGPSPHRRAIVPLYELTTDAAAPRVDGLNALLSLFAWVAQCLGKAGVAALLSGLQGTGKSLVLKVLSIIFGPNMMRSVKKAEQELEKQFGQEFTNTTFAACDEVGDKFFRAVDGASLKEIITGEINTHEVKQKQGMVKTPNNTSFLFLTNESVPTEKLKRRWITVVCANGLRIVGVGGQAALRYFEAFDAALRSPYRNAGILHLLTHYPLVSNLEVYSADKAKTSAALVETPKEFHLRFLVDLCEFPVRAVSDTTDPFWTVVDAEHEGWGEEEVVAKKHLKQLLTDWHAHVCSRRENANDRLANPATSMLKKLEALFAGNATLAEMNAGQPPESFRLSRTHLRRFLREHGYNVRLPPGLPFYEGHETRRAGL